MEQKNFTNLQSIILQTNIDLRLHGNDIIPFRSAFGTDTKSEFFNLSSSGTSVRLKKRGIYKVTFVGETDNKNENINIKFSGAAKKLDEFAQKSTSGSDIHIITQLEFEKGSILRVISKTKGKVVLRKQARLLVEYISN